MDNMIATNDNWFDSFDDNYYNLDATPNNNNLSSIGGSSHLAILRELFSRMSDNRTSFNTHTNSNVAAAANSSSLATGEFPSVFFFPVFHLPMSTADAESYRLLAKVSLWFVLIVNPIVILFGVIGNLLATYILIKCNIAKLPVSFYTVMLNISDTLNLLIPVFIFWLDNCFNRTPERGYFRDKSNFLCKALMCPDQLFAALSAWYMCAISFNRWYSVCRPSSYFLRMSSNPTRGTINGSNQHRNHNNTRKQKLDSKGSTNFSSTFLTTGFSPFDCCFSITSHIKYRQHIQAFRSIGIITLLGILCCLYPIFMHELRPVLAGNDNIFDTMSKVTPSNAVVWNRCYYSRKHEYAYDIIGIILSCLLHILPLTFVAAMSLMIILKLRQRQHMMSASANRTRSSSSNGKSKRTTDADIPTAKTPLRQAHVRFNNEEVNIKDAPSSATLITTHKDQATSTDIASGRTRRKTSNGVGKSNAHIVRRHHSRDRNITIMLVSIALSYLILTLPYRLFWSYNVYIKRMHPERLSSSAYLLKMHHIDHFLRTIRHIHYATNFISFIFLSKTFRRKFRQLCLGRLLRTFRRLCPGKFPDASDFNGNDDDLQRLPSKCKEKRLRPPATSRIDEDHISATDHDPREIIRDGNSYVGDTRMQEERHHSVVIEFRDDDGPGVSKDR